MRILVCGGRDYGKTEQAISKIKDYIKDHNLNPKDIVFLSGGARGADQIPITMFKDEPDTWGNCVVYLADWHSHGKSAGFIRNQRMLDQGRPNLVIAFTGGKGTEHMKNLSKRVGVEVLEWE